VGAHFPVAAPLTPLPPLTLRAILGRGSARGDLFRAEDEMAHNDGDWRPKPHSSLHFTVDASTLDFAPAPNDAPTPQADAASLAVAAPLVTAASPSLFQSIIVNNGGMTFNLEFITADSPTTAFKNDIINAAKLLSAAIPDKVTVNLEIGFGELDGQALANGSAEGGALYGAVESYAGVVNALKSRATAGDANFNSLPSGASLQGYTGVDVWGAELKTLGYVSATSTVDDGQAGFATDIPNSEMVGVALHELSHAMGRTPDADLDIMEMYRFSSVDDRLVQGFTSGVNASPSYFSVDGGVTKLADYGQNSDPGDFANPNSGTPRSNLSPDDSFDQFYGSSTHQFLTALDLTQLDVLGFNTESPPCFCRGGAILTERGAVRVESLAIGDRVVTAGGELRPIVWIGHRDLEVARHRFPLEILPVRVRAGAFGRGLPHRDLWLSPQHAVFVDGALIPVVALANGATVAQMRVETVSYFHVELERHDVLLAEGLPVESFLDCGSRAGFANAAGAVELHPTFRPLSRKDTCAPFEESGERVEAVRRRLQAQAEALGYRRSADPELHIRADGAILWPQRRADGWHDFIAPAGAQDLRLISRTFRPADAAPGGDKRHLGVALLALECDGEPWALGDLGAGWSPLEQDSDRQWRWSDGCAALPAGRRLSLRLGGEPLYWVEDEARRTA
jgi:Hint domain